MPRPATTLKIITPLNMENMYVHFAILFTLPQINKIIFNHALFHFSFILIFIFFMHYHKNIFSRRGEEKMNSR